MARKDVDTMYDDYLLQLISDEECGTQTLRDWSIAYNYIPWYFKVSHPYMTYDAPGDLSMLAHQENL